jgi:hypothetical protein
LAGRFTHIPQQHYKLLNNKSQSLWHVWASFEPKSDTHPQLSLGQKQEDGQIKGPQISDLFTETSKLKDAPSSACQFPEICPK